MKTPKSNPGSRRTNLSSRMRIAAVISLIGMIGIPLFSSSSASSLRTAPFAGQSVSSDQIRAVAAPRPAPSFKNFLTLAMPQAAPEGIATYAADCTTPKSDFALGDTVCVTASGPVDQALVRRRVQFVNPEFLIIDNRDLLTSPQNITFTLPTVATETVDGVPVDNRGTWLVKLIETSDAAAREVVPITVRDPAQVVADLQINTTVIGETSPTAGSTFDVLVWVFNSGPEGAQNVSFSDTSPANTTFQSLIQPLSFQCTTPDVDDVGTTTCTKASMAKGEGAGFILTYKVNGAIANGTGLNSTSTVTSNTADNRDGSNSADTSATGSNPSPPACTITCPDNKTVAANTVNNLNQPGAIVSFSADASGSCGTVTSTPASGSFFPVGTTSVTTSTELGGSCSFTVTVVTEGAPTISCPPDQTVTAAANASDATVNPGSPTTSPSTGVSVLGTRSDGEALTDPYPIGLTIITWTVTDSVGLSSSCSQRIVVNSDACSEDTTPPTITAPDDVTVATPPGTAGSCGLIVGESELGAADANDNCTVNVSRTGVPAGNFFPVGTTVITYTATDSAGQTATDTQTVTVTDGTAPIIEAPADASYTCMSEVPAASPSQATRGDVLDENGNPLPPGPPSDNCGTPVVTVSETSSGAGSASSPRIITRTFTATDGAGNTASDSQIITVTDPEAPSLTLNGASSMTVECHTSFTDPGATATDNCGSATVTTSGAVDVNTPGAYTITYNATDAAGNAATAVTRTVNVVDTTAPIISINGSASMTVECHTGFSDPGATASDSCDSSVPATASGTVDPNVVGVYTITYNASDDSGNAATAVTRTVNVVDTTPPTISCPAGISVNVPANSTATSVSLDPGTATASDSCSTTAVVTGTRSDSQALNAPYPVGATTITWRATDASGNYSECTQTIQVSYIFTGFFSPVSNLPTLNNVNAGRAIPVKFSLSGNKGLAIFESGYPASQQITCSSSAPIAELEGTETSGGSTLTYSPDQYHYNWKTENSWVGTCRQLVIKLNDGSVHTANFKFK